MSSTGAKSLITDNLVINNVFAVQDDGTLQPPGKVLVTDINGLMTYEDYTNGDLWYKVTAATDVNMGGNTIYNCPNMVSEITTSSPGPGGNCINVSAPASDGSGNRSYNITTNITAGSGIDISGNGLGGILITNTDSGSAWYTVPAGGPVNFSGNNLNDTGTISGSGGTVDLSGSIQINGPISNSSGLAVQINDTLDLSGNNIQAVSGISASGTIQANTISGEYLNFTGSLQQNGTSINVVQSVASSGTGSGITVTGGTGANPTISTNLIAGSNITIDTSGNALVLDVTGGGASQWITTGDNIAYTNGTTGGNIGINNNYPLASVDAEGGYSNSGGQYYTSNATITIPIGATKMYFEIIGAGSLDSSGNGGYAIGYFDVSTYNTDNYNIYVNSTTYTTIEGATNSSYVIAYDSSGNEPSGTNGTIANGDYVTIYPSSCIGSLLPSYILPGYGRPGQPGLVYISFKQPSIRATGDIISGGTIIGSSINTSGAITGGSLDVSSGAITGGSLDVSSGSITGGSLDVSSGTISGGSLDVSGGTITGGLISGTSLDVSSGAISGGSITGTSLDVSSGAISGGTITGTSLDVSGGAISGGTITGTSLTITGNADISGYIYTPTTLLASALYSPDTGSNMGSCTISPQPTILNNDVSGSVQISSLLPSGYPYTTSGYVRVQVLVVGGGAGGTIGGPTGAGGGGGSGQEISGIYYLPVTSNIIYNIGAGGPGGNSSSNNGVSGEPTTVDISSNNIYIKAYGASQTPNSGQGGNGWYGGGGGAAFSGNNSSGGLSYSSVYPLVSGVPGYTPIYQFTTGQQTSSGSGLGGKGDGPGSNGGAGGSFTNPYWGGGGGGSSTIGIGGNGGDSSNNTGSNGTFGAGGGGGTSQFTPLSSYDGGYGGAGAVWIQIFSV